MLPADEATLNTTIHTTDMLCEDAAGARVRGDDKEAESPSKSLLMWSAEHRTQRWPSESERLGHSLTVMHMGGGIALHTAIGEQITRSASALLAATAFSALRGTANHPTHLVTSRTFVVVGSKSSTSKRPSRPLSNVAVNCLPHSRQNP